MTEYCITQTTVRNPDEARTLAELLLKDRLAACVQIVPITSLYTWNDRLQHEHEHLLVIKSKIKLYPRIESLLRTHHSYDVPEIIRIPIEEGSADYLKWIDSVTDNI